MAAGDPPNVTVCNVCLCRPCQCRGWYQAGTPMPFREYTCPICTHTPCCCPRKPLGHVAPLAVDPSGWEQRLTALEGQLRALCESMGLDLNALAERAGRALPKTLTAEPHHPTPEEVDAAVQEIIGDYWDQQK